MINDGKRTRAEKFNMVTTIIGSIFIILGIIFFLISATSVSYIDRSGVLHENFFLVPLGYLSLFVGILIIRIKITMENYFYGSQTYCS